MSRFYPIYALIALSNCMHEGAQAKPQVYTVSKAVSTEAMPLGPRAEQNTFVVSSQDVETMPSWQVPFHWEAQDLGSLRKGSWIVKEGLAKVDISVLAFPGETGGILANVNRWAQQIGLKPILAEKLEDCVKTYSVGQRAAHYVSLKNPETKEATLGVIVPLGQVFWFFKMMGNEALVRKEQESFNQFLKTVQF
jgi:hypothetical protein